MIRALVELLRPPNVFTAVADSFAGLVLVRAGHLALDDRGLWCRPASAGLYLGGMALNDYFDGTVDAVERPERPIPSGRVPAHVAAAVGFGLLAAGVLLAAFAGRRPLVVALLLAVSIAVYDAALKGSVAGYFNMGLCRALN